MDEAKKIIHIDNVKGFVQGDNNTINIIEHNTRQLDWNRRLIIARDLRPESFKLGDVAAAKFPYVVKPIQDTYYETINGLHLAGTQEEPAKCGVLILGEANAGKTRLAFEALRQTLPDWQVLRWRPDYTIDHAPPAEFISGKRFVIFIDDLQDYIATQIATDPHITILRTLLETFTQFAKRIVVITTCRSEDTPKVQMTLNWLFVQLTQIILPVFDTNIQNPKAAYAITEFRKKGTIHIEDWDGTLGSLVLGLSAKNSQYLVLSIDRKPAATVLKAMKLLNNALIMEHTEQRIRAISAYVFGDKELRENQRVWREAKDQLTLLQFVTVDDSERALVIRKDTYFDKIVTDYPPSSQPKQVERDFTQLEKILVELKDAEALSNLGIKLALLNRKKDALTAVNHALSIDQESPSKWYSKGMVHSLFGEHEEAQTAFNHASKLDTTPLNDQFTEQARKVLSLAEEEAQRLQHNYIGTEHLLLGLIREGEGVAAKVLSGIELNKARAAIEFMIGRGDHIVPDKIGLTPRASKVIELAADEARRLNHHYIGTEHLLLGLARQSTAISTAVLNALSADLESIRRQVFQALGLYGTSYKLEEPQLKMTVDAKSRFDQFTEQARKVFSLAEEEAQRLQHNYIGTEHLLLGLIREGEGVAAKVLDNVGMSLIKVRAGVEFILGLDENFVSDKFVVTGVFVLTPRTERVIELAADEARRLNHHYIGTEHLLLGLMREGKGIAFGLLESFEVSLEEVKKQILLLLGLNRSSQMPGEKQVKVPQLQNALDALDALLFEKNQAIEQLNYELATQLQNREMELRDNIYLLESIEIYLHRKPDTERHNSTEEDVV